MKLISKQEPVKPVAPYVWGAKYLVLDSVPDMRTFAVKRGDTVIATKESLTGSFKVNTEKDYGYIHPQHLQLIDAAPQPEYVPVTVDTAVIGKQYLLIADGYDVPKGEIVTLDRLGRVGVAFRVTSADDHDWVHEGDLAELPAKSTSETIYTVELTESELQGIVTAMSGSTKTSQLLSVEYYGFPVESVNKTTDVRDEIKKLLKENKQ